MNKERKYSGYFRFGFSSILLTFVILCIATFGALSLTTASSDYKLSQKVAESTANYYSAETEVNQKLASIDEELSKAYTSSKNLAEFRRYLPSEWQETDEDGVYIYKMRENITENRYLDVTISCSYPNTGTYNYQIVTWKTVTEMTEEPNTTLHLIGEE